ncbi:hypothetical protein KGM_208263 [Danaus plexippus plexippus]|uniref:FLYWCH-type domain-containing protein n=1 Tax=Danaus plexippus plexippus TaxID=278856 RepID=A0A212EXP4_DANPL|nr:hypothetical protein KGM_208263 [Danaus plexippus plexippus]
MVLPQFDMCINNAWLLHRRDGKKTSLKDFRFELFDGLSKSNRIGTNQNVTDDIGENLKIHKPVSVRPTDSVRFDNTGHLPEAAEYVASKEGGTLIKLNDFTYNLSSQNGPKSKWQCSTHAAHGCHAVLYTFNNVIVGLKDLHNHAAPT